MKIYLLSLGAGVLVGVIYSLLNVRSPAPPLIALIGLLGILSGEQLIPVCKHLLAGSPLRSARRDANGTSDVFGIQQRMTQHRRNHNASLTQTTGIR